MKWPLAILTNVWTSRHVRFCSVFILTYWKKRTEIICSTKIKEGNRCYHQGCWYFFHHMLCMTIHTWYLGLFYHYDTWDRMFVVNIRNCFSVLFGSFSFCNTYRYFFLLHIRINLMWLRGFYYLIIKWWSVWVPVDIKTLTHPIFKP